MPQTVTWSSPVYVVGRGFSYKCPTCGRAMDCFEDDYGRLFFECPRGEEDPRCRRVWGRASGR
jgi:DNA-directed RNA polymerase subunit RPC12/RpoP